MSSRGRSAYKHLSGLLALSERIGRDSQREIHTLRRGESALPLLFASSTRAVVVRAGSVLSVSSQVPQHEEDLILTRSREFGVVG